ncbi:MAG: cytidylate kinase [Candidatus Cloacimonadota bacterium]|nr:MAG: cytidylate kinase [Candidatus Cloacimonadota bacterium]
MIVAIDGPAGAGKSTIANKLSKMLNIHHMDSGAIYRCYTLAAMQSNTNTKSQTEMLKLVKESNVRADYSTIPAKFYLNNVEVGESIRENKISSQVSFVATHKCVRDAVVNNLRETSKSHSFVVEGRDIGSVVFPNAEHKFFLTASIEVRAKRRFSDLKSAGEEISFEQLCQDIEKRDHIDSSRDIAPLIQATNAQLIDSSNMNIDEVVEHLNKVINPL